MIQTVRNLITQNAPLKITSLILGYSFWHLFGATSPITREVTVPICFYNTPTHIHLDAPEAITLTLCGKRRDLRSLDITNLACHINAHHVTAGRNPMRIAHEQLFLPNTIKLVHYSPTPIVVMGHTVVDKQTKNSNETQKV